MPHTSTTEMTHNEWLKRRSETIGSSDIGVILGFVKQKTPRHLLSQKLGIIPADEENSAMEWGTKLEDFCHTMFAEKHPGVKVRKDNKIRQHPDHPWATCNLDRVIVGGDSGPTILELKTTVEWSVKNWEQAVPLSYYAQVQWQMFITGWKKAVIWVAVLDSRRFIELNVDRSDEFISVMLQSAAQFHEALEAKNPELLPMAPSDLESIKPEVGSSVEATPDILELVSSIRIQSDAINTAKKQLDETKERVKAFIAEKEALVEKETGRVLATYKLVHKDGYHVQPSDTRQLALVREKKEKAQ